MILNNLSTPGQQQAAACAHITALFHALALNMGMHKHTLVWKSECSVCHNVWLQSDSNKCAAHLLGLHARC